MSQSAGGRDLSESPIPPEMPQDPRPESPPAQPEDPRGRPHEPLPGEVWAPD